jgi:hypothetical protein
MFDDTETLQPELLPQSDSHEVESQQAPASQEEEQSKSNAQQNFKQLREKSERIARERDEAIARLREYESRIKSQSPTQAADVESDEISMAPDELAEGKHISKVQKQLNKLKEEVRLANIKSQIQSQYPDFYSVVTNENVKILQEKYPTIANSLNSSSDLYSTAASTYTLIKELNLNSQARAYDTEKQVVHANAAKPRPLASVSPQQGDSPLSRANAFANGLTEELKVQLRREMEESRRNM